MSEILAFIAVALSVVTFILAIYTHFKLKKRNEVRDKIETWEQHTPKEQSEILGELSKDNKYDLGA